MGSPRLLTSRVMSAMGTTHPLKCHCSLSNSSIHQNNAVPVYFPDYIMTPYVTIPEFTKERYLSRVAKARALVPLREKFAHFLFSSYLFFYFIFHLLCYISVSHKVCSFQWCQKFYMLYWEIKIGSQNGDFEWLCKSQPYLRVQNL